MTDDDNLTRDVEHTLNQALRTAGIRVAPPPRCDSRQPPITTTLRTLTPPKLPARKEKFLPNQQALFS